MSAAAVALEEPAVQMVKQNSLGVRRRSPLQSMLDLEETAHDMMVCDW
jgi:hypothetical protein